MPIEKQKLNTLNKLIDHGADTEKKITAMGIQEIIAVSKITVPEIHIITELQDAIKARATIAYLAGADEKPAGKDAKKNPERPDADEGSVTGYDLSNSKDETAADSNNADYTKESEVRKHDRFHF